MKQSIHTLPLAVIIALVVLFTGCNKQVVKDLSTPGEKGTVTSKYAHKNLDGTDLLLAPIAPFSEVKNDGSMKVVVVPDDVFAIGVAASTTDEELVSTRVVDGVLTVSYTDELGVDNPDNIVYVHSPIVDKMTMTRKGTVESAGYYSRLDVNMQGKGKIVLTGGIATLNIAASGQGEVDAHGMPAIDVVVTGKSNGIISVAPINTLNVNVSGSAKIYYTGSPSVTSRLGGGAQLIHQ
mgnify:FL=1